MTDVSMKKYTEMFTNTKLYKIYKIRNMYYFIYIYILYICITIRKFSFKLKFYICTSKNMDLHVDSQSILELISKSA